MLFARRMATLLVLVVVAGGTAWSTGKITTDPNAAPKVEAPDPADSRLDQKITYASGQVRLHTVADDLARMTGVKIFSGRDSSDWAVRDIPLVVCVKEMPLGKLLQAIADATHTSLSCERTADDPRKAYRVFRTIAAQNDIDTYFARRRENQLALAKWQWDAMATCANAASKPKEIDPHDWIVARLLAAMGPQARDRVLAGDVVEPDLANSKVELLREELYREFKLKWINRGLGTIDKVTVDNLDLSKAKEARVTVELRYGGDSGRIQIEVSIADRTGESSSYLEKVRGVRDKLTGLPAYPNEFASPPIKDDMGNADMALLSTDKDMDRPLLKAKIDVVKPDDIEKPVFADLIRAVAAASGLNIVTEDFSSHQSADEGDSQARFLAGAGPEYGSVDKLFAKGTDVATTLRGLNVGKNYCWFINEADKLLVGWSQGSRETGWRGEHRNLLSETYLNDLRAKVRGKGAQADDVVHLVSVSRESFVDWIVLDRDLKCLGRVQDCSEPGLWQLYDSLSAADKRFAKSESGFLLSRIDRKWLTAFFRERKLINTGNELADHSNLPDRVFSDPAAVSSMVMHVANNEMSSAEYMSNIRVDYNLDGEERQDGCDLGGMIFPIRSAEREAEQVNKAK